MSALDVALARIPFLASSEVRSSERLAGLTNVNHLVVTDDGRYVVRLPGAGTAEYIDRSAEATAARSASDAGVNAELLFFDASDGLMVTRFVDGARTMDETAFHDHGAVVRAGEAFGRLHRAADAFSTEFDLFGMIDEYRRLLAAKGARLPEGYDELQHSADHTRAALARTPVALVPSHCDPLCENFLDTGERMYLIDYEYAGNNDPMWDLADLTVEGNFDEVRIDVLLEAYLGRPASGAERGRVEAYRAMCDLLWTLWGVIQHVNGNPADDFWAYASGRFERCRRLMSRPEYARHLAHLVDRS